MLGEVGFGVGLLVLIRVVCVSFAKDGISHLRALELTRNSDQVG